MVIAVYKDTNGDFSHTEPRGHSSKQESDMRLESTRRTAKL